MKNIILVLSLFIAISCGDSKPNESDAKEAARAAIIHNLINPSGVKFYHDEIVKDLGNGEFEYSETVDATNTFGGSIAQKATAKIKWNGGDPSKMENWSVLDVQFYER